MKFIILGPANKDTEAGVLPSGEEIEKMMKFQEELVKAGVVVAGEGLRAERGTRIEELGAWPGLLDSAHFTANALDQPTNLRVASGSNR